MVHKDIHPGPLIDSILICGLYKLLVTVILSFCGLFVSPDAHNAVEYAWLAQLSVLL